jgi:hypothetical protein
MSFLLYFVCDSAIAESKAVTFSLSAAEQCGADRSGEVIKYSIYQKGESDPKEDQAHDLGKSNSTGKS